MLDMTVFSYAGQYYFLGDTSIVRGKIYLYFHIWTYLNVLMQICTYKTKNVRTIKSMMVDI